MAKNELLARAKAAKARTRESSRIWTNPERIGVAVAYLKGEISITQICMALKVEKGTTSVKMGILTALEAAYENGVLKIDESKLD